MLEKLAASSGPVVGYKVVGKVTVEDYQQLDPAIQALVDQYDDVCLLLFLDGHIGQQTPFLSLDELESRQVRVLNLKSQR